MGGHVLGYWSCSGVNGKFNERSGWYMLLWELLQEAFVWIFVLLPLVLLVGVLGACFLAHFGNAVWIFSTCFGNTFWACACGCGGGGVSSGGVVMLVVGVIGCLW